MIGEVAFNYPFHAFDDERNSEALALLAAIHEYSKEARHLFVNPLRHWMYRLSDVRRYHGAIGMFRRLCQEMYRQFLDTPPEQRDPTSIIFHIHKAPYASDFERIGDIFMLFLAGHDTTGFTISWGVYHLAKNPRVLKKLQQELDGADFAGDLPTYEELSPLPYFNACIKEIMRISPVASNGSIRQTEGGMKVTSGGVDYWLPGGYEIYAAIMPVLTDDRIWGDGNVFRPERWLEASEEQLKLYNKAFQPFSMAPRSCIGTNLAMIEVRLTMAVLFTRYEFEVIQEPTPVSAVTYKPQGLTVRSIKRT
ncbi:unnamed protein product [Vitrella brassicaformis CCMP3155]|uniref:Cytochrome P450 n=2 Tax=Vitrella brassicaformis TaxID=1169539 RepID=A0A0G4FHD2_VITBC|nr:unnamed protein product [Vitrella brassicaformis CCMP3155]|mmetsp:Transcript_53079/g.133592  ORF Transcript_53079/g.133592 Transcript_53079/m.133592 type:complete len:308 (+) Transcript_53079:1154-2077(+)|eukprot:CEM12702.1 unnamed protein product [Vitrella brassicaformis CCMP3155]